MRFARILLAAGVIALVAPLAPVAYAEHADVATATLDEAAQSDAEEGENQGLEVAKGCAAGALAGSVVPGLGTIVGCLVGGAAEWWFNFF